MNELVKIIKSKARKEFDNEENLIENGVLDSIDFIYVINEIENKFGIAIDFLEIDPSQITSVNGLWRIIKNGLE